MISISNLDKFFWIAREREQIAREKAQDLPKPWTAYPIFQQYRFCNVFRCEDRTSKYIQEIALKDADTTYKIAAGVLVARWFNRIETIKLLHAKDCLWNFDKHKAMEALHEHRGPLVTGAYVIKSPNGFTKKTGILNCIHWILVTNKDSFTKFVVAIQQGQSIEQTVAWLVLRPYLGQFMAYQIACDLIDLGPLSLAPDRYTWAQLGPGSARGLGRLVGNDPTMYSYGSKGDRDVCLELMRYLLEESKKEQYWPHNDFIPWEMQTVQHWLCEYDKYCRAEEGGRMKRKFNGKGA